MSENIENTNDFVTEEEINKAVAELTADGYLGDEYDTPEDVETDELEKAVSTKKADDEEEEEVETNAEIEEEEVEKGKNKKWGGNKDEYKRRDGHKIGDKDGHYKDYEDDAKKADESRGERADVDKYEYEEGLIDGMHDKDVEDEEKSYYKAVKGGKGTYHQFNKAGTKRVGTKTFVKKGDKFVANTISKALGAGHNIKPVSTNNPNEEVNETIEVTPILKSFQDTILSLNEENNKKFQSTGTILKGLLEQIENLSNKVDEMSKEPNPRKSTVRTPYTDRFEKGETETKGLSIAKDKAKILNMMDELTFAKGSVDDDMAKAMTNFETTSRLSQPIALRIEKELGVRIYN